jgi:transposase-like protein
MKPTCPNCGSKSVLTNKPDEKGNALRRCRICGRSYIVNLKEDICEKS